MRKKGNSSVTGEIMNGVKAPDLNWKFSSGNFRTWRSVSEKEEKERK